MNIKTTLLELPAYLKATEVESNLLQITEALASKIFPLACACIWVGGYYCFNRLYSERSFNS